ncbi:MAG: PD40 domain-containing protein [Acidobacteria bacterium]|nr:PD40 domain-containing protein [Acidobacteriota bacterium]
MRPIFLAAIFCAGLAAAPEIHFYQRPTMSRTEIVFSYAGDLWRVPREGGKAQRLTVGTGFETEAVFSPDGATIAFTGEYDGNIDVYTIPAAGGVPKRLTYHPDADRVVGWSPDGKRVLFRSNRTSHSRYTELFTISVEGGFPEKLPLPMACMGQYSPDGKRMVYAPIDGGQFATGFTNYVAWRRYRGGTASYLWIVDFPSLDTAKIPRTDSNDIYPMWIGSQIYFLSDRSGPMTLFRYDPASKKVDELIHNTGQDIWSASAGPGGIVYEQFGQIHIYDTASGRDRIVPIEVDADLTEVRPRFQNVSRELRNAAISSTGVRAVFEAHGDIITVPADKGEPRNLTNSPGVMDRNPAWSPDGKTIAWFSDESGEYALHIKSQTGEGETKKIPLEGKSAFYFDPKWSPDSKSLAFTDNMTNLWCVDVASGKLTRVDSDYLYELGRGFNWSGDSKWIAFEHFGANRMRTIWVWNAESARSTQITDGMSDARHPAFDRDGQYLYFTASTNYGPTSSGLDMTSDEHEVTSSVYLAVLPDNIPSPLKPESDEENQPRPAAENGGGRGGRGGTGTGPAAPETPPKPVRIDFDRIQQRILALPLPARNYMGLTAGRPGIVFLLEPGASGGGRGGFGGGATLTRFDLKTRKSEKLADNVAVFDLSANGDKMLLRVGAAGDGGRGGRGAAGPASAPQFVIVPSNAPIKPGEGALRTADLEVKVDPRAEWSQMYHEVWRIERSYFYDPNLHGLNAADAEKGFEKYLPALGSRADLNYLFRDMLSDITSGHLRGNGGTIPTARTVSGGLLGADYEISGGRYRFKKIYLPESWNPQITSPLAQPGLNVKEGDFLLAVNGQDLAGTDDVQRLLENTAGKQTLLKIAADAAGRDAREITVVPIASETALRHSAWLAANHKKVDELSGGKLAYVYMPDTGQGGYTSFNRYYFAQSDKSGAIIDERFNSGGQVADYVIDALNRKLLAWWSPRYGAIYRTPAASILGPKVMIVNEMAGSGGDAMPWMFHYTRTGPLIGKRTWGGLIGISQYPTLMDGGSVTAPNFGFFSPDGKWDVENHGVAPDIEIDQDPKSVAEGHDPQLERAVKEALVLLEKNPPPTPRRPEYPNYQRPARPANSTPAPGGNR